MKFSLHVVIQEFILDRYFSFLKVEFNKKCFTVQSISLDLIGKVLMLFNILHYSLGHKKYYWQNKNFVFCMDQVQNKPYI